MKRFTKCYIITHSLPHTLLHHTHPVTARFTISFGRDGLKDVLNVRPCVSMSARHERGSIACSLFSSTHTTADKENTLLGKGLAATLERRERENGREGECIGGAKIGKRKMGGNG